MRVQAAWPGKRFWAELTDSALKGLLPSTGIEEYQMDNVSAKVTSLGASLDFPKVQRDLLDLADAFHEGQRAFSGQEVLKEVLDLRELALAETAERLQELDRNRLADAIANLGGSKIAQAFSCTPAAGASRTWRRMRC